MAYRILSLDGGGIRGVIAAVILSEVEKYLDQPLNQYFDMIAGTSTGSILASAIAVGLKSQDIIRLYKEQGQRIFPYQSRFSPQRLRLLFQYGISAPKYSNNGLIAVLQEQFGTTKLSDIYDSPRLLIIAYDTQGREPIVFKSWRQDENYFNVPLWEACVCSSSAPTFFPAYLLQTPRKRYSAIDGGIGANNPSASALAEVLRLRHPIDEIVLLSIGTGSSAQPFPWEEARSWGVSQWLWQGRLLDVVFGASADIHEYISRQVLNAPGLENEQCNRYLRLQPEIMNFEIDDARPQNLDNLVMFARDYIGKNKDVLINFLNTNCS